jgi:hypothetical protein
MYTDNVQMKNTSDPHGVTFWACPPLSLRDGKMLGSRSGLPFSLCSCPDTKQLLHGLNFDTLKTIYKTQIYWSFATIAKLISGL